MIEPHKTRANIGILIGIVAAIGGNVWLGLMGEDPDLTMILPLLLSLAGTAAFIYGCVQYALAKGRSPGWGAIGLLGLIGLIVLVCLKDYSQDRRPRGFPVQPVRRY